MSFMEYPQPDACRALMPTPEPAPPGPPSVPMFCHMPKGHDGPHAITRRPRALDRRWEGDARPAEQIPYMLENTPEEFQRVRDLAWPAPAPARYAQCDETCTVDCGHCKGAGRPAPVAAEGTDELRERAEQLWSDLINEDDRGAVDKLTALLAKVQAVEALANELDTPVPNGSFPGQTALYGGGDVSWRIRRALGGESR